MGKKALLVLAICLGIVAAGATAFVSFLRSPAGSRFILAQAKQALQKQGATFDYAQGSVDPFSGAYFENLKLTQTQGGRRLEVFIPKLDLKYRISFFARRLDVSRFLIESPRVLVRSEGEAAPAQAQPQSTVAQESTDARRWILSPPVQISMRDFDLNRLELDVEQSGPTGSLRAKLSGLTLHLGLDGLRRKLESSGQLDLGELKSLDLVTVAPDGSRSLAQLRAKGTAKWSATIHPEASGWAYELTPAESRFEVREVTWSKSGSSGSTRAKIPWVRVGLTSKILAKTTELLALDSGSLRTVDTEAKLEVAPVEVDQSARGKAPSRMTLASQALRFKSGLKDGFLFELSYDGQKLRALSLLTREADLNAMATLHLTQDLRSAESRSHLSFGGIPLMDASIDARVEQGALVAHAQAQASLDNRLPGLVRQAAPMSRLGRLTSELALELRAAGTFATVFDGAAKVASQAPVEGKVTLAASQKGAADSEIRFAPASVEVRFARDPVKQSASAQLSGELPSVLAPPLKKACALGLTGELRWNEAKELLDAQAALKVQKQEAVSLAGHSVIKPDLLQTDASLELKTGDYLEGLFTAGSLKGYGQWLMKSQLQLKKTQQSFQENGSLVITQLAAPGALAVSLPEPVKVTHHLDIDGSHTDGELSADMPLLEAAGYGRVRATRFNASAHTPQGALGKDVDLALAVKQGDIELAPAITHGAPKLAGLDVEAKARLRGGDRFELERLSADFGHSLLKLTADATGKLSSRDFETRGTLSLRFPEDFPKVAGQLLRGRAELPWTLSIVGGKELDFDGKLSLLELAASSAEGGIQGLSGSVPIEEKLVWDGRRLHFAHLIRQNPFERVDFERVRPLLEGADHVRVDEIHWGEKTYGPLVAFVSMRQNMIQAQQFDMSMGTGRIYGQMFLDAYPANLQFGLLSRITELKLGEILPKKYLAKVSGGEHDPLSARFGIVLDVNKSTVDGRIDVTELSPTHANMLINVMDPEFQDDRMNRIRGDLAIGKPEYMEMAMDNGYMDMKVVVAVAGKALPPFFIRGFAISPWISDASASILKTTKEGPLK